MSFLPLFSRPAERRCITPDKSSDLTRESERKEKSRAGESQSNHVVKQPKKWSSDRQMFTVYILLPSWKHLACSFLAAIDHIAVHPLYLDLHSLDRLKKSSSSLPYSIHQPCTVITCTYITHQSHYTSANNATVITIGTTSISV